MPTYQRRRFLHGQVAWMVGSLLCLAALDALSLKLFFVVSLIGFLVVLELTAPLNVTPQWRRRLRWILALAMIGFVAIVVRRILAILPSGVI